MIIGNPPYVKLEQIKAQSEQLAHARFATYEKRGDLYVLFVEQGFRLLASDGLISYIMPNKWLQAGYGKPLRRLFSQQHLHSLIDFGDVQIFEGATTYPCIFTAGKRQPENIETAAVGRILESDKTSAVQETSDTSIRPTPSENTAPVGWVSTQQTPQSRTDGESRPTLPAARTVAVSTLQTALAADFDENVRRNRQYFPADSFGEDTWIISSQQGSGLLGRLKEKFPTLKDFIGGEAYYGMKPGLSEAFFIDEETKNRLIKEDPNSAEIIKPMLRGRDISRYQNNFADVYMLFVPWHFPLHLDNSIAGASLEAEAAFSKQYPAVYKHLLQFKEKLADRNKSEVGIRYEWYALQRWAANYWQEFSKPKIMYQAFQVKPCFIYDESGLHCNNSMWIMPSENKGLLAVLNSKMGWWLVSQYCTQIQNGYQLIWQYFGQIPMPAPTAELAAQADTLLRLTAALHTVRQNLLDELGLEKIPAKLQQFELLDLDGFIAELAKAKKLKFADKLAQREFKQQWQRIFEQDKAAVLDLQTKIAAADQAADQMVYQLYGLTEDEIRLIENP